METKYVLGFIDRASIFEFRSLGLVGVNGSGGLVLRSLAFRI